MPTGKTLKFKHAEPVISRVEPAFLGIQPLL